MSDRRCPKCRKGQPLYKKRLRAGTTAVVEGQQMKIQVDVTVFDCVRCRGVFR